LVHVALVTRKLPLDQKTLSEDSGFCHRSFKTCGLLALTNFAGALVKSKASQRPLQDFSLHEKIREPMEIHSIKYCLAVYSERNFTRAAKRCGVAQPSLSNAIRKLERELGGALFVRNTNGIELTLLGRAVRPHFEEIGRRIERVRRISANLANAGAARLKA
jgi:hypothetical protein